MAIVCNIEKYSIHDGPGIRTAVFLKGCPLRCIWCSNPETVSLNNELYYDKNKCIGCQTCVRACKYEAIIFNEKEKHIEINRKLLANPKECAGVCPTKALTVVGNEMTVQEVFDEVMKDVIFYNQSGGGVTASGGEVLLHADFISELFEKCKEEFIHTAVETSGYGTKEALLKLSEQTDLFLFDIKQIDSAKHKELTGVDNKTIIDNLRTLRSLGKNVILRLPLIPYLNDTKEDILAVIILAKELGIIEMHLLPYHTLGMDKYRRLQKDYTTVITNKRDSTYYEQLKTLIENNNLQCMIGG